MTTTNVARPYYDSSSMRMLWVTDSTVNSNTFYNLTDDSPVLKKAIGKNCWINNSQPDAGSPMSIALVIKEIPNFTREDYSYESPAYLFHDRSFQSFSIEKVNGCTTSVGTNPNNIAATNSSGSTGGVPVFFYHPTQLQANHKYLILASVNIEQAIINDLYTKYAGAEAAPGELIDHLDIAAGGRYVVTGSVMRSLTTIDHNLFPCKMCGPDVRTYNMSLRWIVVYDLTELGLEDRVNTVKEGISLFGVPTEEDSFMGTPYRMITSHDFSTPTEIYVPDTFTVSGIDIYDRYWKEYIADLYSVDTRVMTAEIYLKDIRDSFKKFYWYNNALWVLSSITDWNPETKICKATLLKVNDKGDYTEYMDIIPGLFNAPHGGTELTLNFKKNGAASAITWTSNNAWIHDLNDERSGQFSENSCTFVIDANTGTASRTGTITFNWNGKSYIYTITQDGLFTASVVVIGGTCDYTLSTTTFSPGDEITLTFTPGLHQHLVSIRCNKEDVTNSIQNSSLSYTAKNENVIFYITVAPDPVIGVDVVVNNRAGGYPFLKDKEGNYIVDQTFEGEDIQIDFRTNERFKVGEFIVNGVDLTNQIVNDKYTITNVSGNQSIRITYEYTSVWFEIIATPDNAQIVISKL